MCLPFPLLSTEKRYLEKMSSKFSRGQRPNLDLVAKLNDLLGRAVVVDTLPHVRAWEK